MIYQKKMEINKIIEGNVLEILKTFEDEYIDCVVTSPPYWAVRDYDNEEQIGLEEHPQEYIDKIVEVMKECKRILKKEGTIFLNLGDSYYTKSGLGQGSNFLKRHQQLSEGRDTLKEAHTKTRGKFHSNWLQSKQRLLIPFRIAIKCQNELGLILRNDINWVKQWCNWKTKESAGASMPTSVQDRLNTNSESIFFFVKQKKYYFNLDEIRVPNIVMGVTEKRPAGIFRQKLYDGSSYNKSDDPHLKQYQKPDRPDRFVRPDNLARISKHWQPKDNIGKNPGDCVMFPLEPTKEEHFAIFPTTLPEFCIKCGCPEEGIVLDPFIGFGTTGVVALKLGRKFIGIELNKKYIDMANERIKPYLEQTKLSGLI